MKIQDLTREQLELLNTDFGDELEKQAEAIVDEEYEKLAELEGHAEDLYNYGAELAMQKIAEMEANYKEGDKEKEKEGEDEDEEEEEEEKQASAMGNFILEGYWNTMMEKGAEYYNDQNIYLEELVKEAGMDKVAAGAMRAALYKAMQGAKKSYRRAMPKVKEKASEYADKAKEALKGRYGAGTKGRRYLAMAGVKNKTQRKALGRAAKTYAPELAGLGVAGAAGGALAYNRNKNK
jgi:hypothetical protein